MRLIDLFQEMAKKKVKKKEAIRDEYYRVKEELKGEVPRRMDLFTYMDDEIYQICLQDATVNPFHNYLEFLKGLGELSGEEKLLYDSIGGRFLNNLETTSMSKSYKMPILLAFYNDGNIKMEIDEDDVCRSYKEFYRQGIYWKDLEKHKSTRDFKQWDKKTVCKRSAEKSGSCPFKFRKRILC